MNKSDFTTIFEILLQNGNDRVGCSITSDFDMDVTVIAGAMVAILDAVLNQLDDCDQIQAEQQIVALFNEMVEERHAYTSKEILEDDD